MLAVALVAGPIALIPVPIRLISVRLIPVRLVAVSTCLHGMLGFHFSSFAGMSVGVAVALGASECRERGLRQRPAIKLDYFRKYCSFVLVILLWDFISSVKIMNANVEFQINNKILSKSPVRQRCFKYKIGAVSWVQNCPL